MTTKMTEKEVKRLHHGYCPDCGSSTFYHGPCGGCAENIRCAGCGHEFNFSAPFDSERIDRDDRSAYHELFDLHTWLYDMGRSYRIQASDKGWLRVYRIASYGFLGAAYGYLLWVICHIIKSRS